MKNVPSYEPEPTGAKSFLDRIVKFSLTGIGRGKPAAIERWDERNPGESTAAESLCPHQPAGQDPALKRGAQRAFTIVLSFV